MNWWSVCPCLNLPVLQGHSWPKTSGSFSSGWYVVGISVGAAAELSWDHHRTMRHNRPPSCFLPAVLCLLRASQNLKLLSYLLPSQKPDSTRPGWFIRNADFWHQHVHSRKQNQQSRFLTWRISASCSVAKTELTKLPSLTNSAIIGCFCAGLVKTSNTFYVSKWVLVFSLFLVMFEWFRDAIPCFPWCLVDLSCGCCCIWGVATIDTWEVSSS